MVMTVGFYVAMMASALLLGEKCACFGDILSGSLPQHPCSHLDKCHLQPIAARVGG